MIVGRDRENSEKMRADFKGRYFSTSLKKYRIYIQKYKIKLRTSLNSA